MSNFVLKNNDVEKHDPHSVAIIVNGRSYNVEKKDLSFEEIVKLAFGNMENSNSTAYTVTYSYKNGHNHDNGIMVNGDVVKNVKKGMIFNVTKTSRS